MPNVLQKREAAPEPAPDEEDKKPAATIVSVIYVTAEKTFDGDAVYVTEMPESSADGFPPAPTTIEEGNDPGAIDWRPTQSRKEDTEKPAAPSTTAGKSTPSLRSSTLATTTLAASPVVSSTPNSSDPTSTFSAGAAAATSTENAAPTSPQSEGMSGGAKAGLALGILIAIGAILALILLFYRRKKQQNEAQQLDDEKFDMGTTLPPPPPPAKSSSASIRTAKTASTAPRLSLRPVTEFLPIPVAGDRRSTGNKPEMTAATSTADTNGSLAPAAAAAGGSAWERPGAHNHPSDPANPFGNHAETVESPKASGPAEMLASTTPTKAELVSPASPIEPQNSFPVAAAAVPAQDGSKPLSVNQEGFGPIEMPAQPIELPAAPVSSPPMAAAIPASPVPKPSGPSNVHRVQLDFNPNPDMPDELQLRAGQLVRVLHEYDDGWALCSRMDRSQQGVAPRTCLSKHPVKPRPASPTSGRPGANSPRMGGPPKGPLPLPLANGRNSPVPFAGQGSPVPPPAAGRNSPVPLAGQPRAASPAGGRIRSQSNAPIPGAFRSASPGPYGAGQGPPRPETSRRRSNSASGITGLRTSPLGPSPMNPAAVAAASPRLVPQRKPVPGQTA